MDNGNMVNLKLSSEQNEFIAKALAGSNILVDACIGSGKTTAIQQLCNAFPQDKRILYLTYNRLLKLDAQAKIRSANTTVTNYHGFAMGVLRKANITCGIPELVYTFNRIKPPIDMYDVLILDEYQDIEQELADMLLYIKSTNPHMQIIAVGDMMQKIYDKTTLNVPAFMDEFLGEHIILSFTKCFRISAQLAEKLGYIWQKEIIGVNNDCIVEEMTPDAVVEFLAKQQPRDMLCLGQRTGLLSKTLNELENRYPERFNKKTVYASIRDEDGGTSKPGKDAAIFTTFDSSKGLERPICVVFDYTESYWRFRVEKPQTSCEILRNIFCVAASRGKQHIIFVNSGEAMLSEESLRAVGVDNSQLENVGISEMFQFKYKEDVEACYALLDVCPICLSENNQIIHVKLLAINGIGPQNAKRILAESSRIAKEVRATIAAKPNFTQNATGKKVIQEYCRYKWTAKVHASIEDILASEEKLIDEYCSMVTPASGALRWAFTFSRKKKDSALQAAAVLQKRIKSTTEELANAAENLYAHCSKISFEDAWRDYMKSTDEYNSWITKNSISEA